MGKLFFQPFLICRFNALQTITIGQQNHLRQRLPHALLRVLLWTTHVASALVGACDRQRHGYNENRMLILFLFMNNRIFACRSLHSPVHTSIIKQQYGYDTAADAGIGKVKDGTKKNEMITTNEGNPMGPIPRH